MNPTVFSFFFEKRQVRETVFIGVFHDKNTLGFEQIFFDYECGNGIDTGQIVRRIGKNKVKFLVT
jgi:hypothetical protein